MSKFPSLPLFTDAYFGDTKHLTCEEHGAYLQLLMIAWRSPGCSIPNDDAKIARMIGLTAKRWQSIKPTIMAFWTLGEDGAWHQARLEKEHVWVSERSEKRATAGKMGGRPKSLADNDPDKAKGFRDESKAEAPNPIPIPSPIDSLLPTVVGSQLPDGNSEGERGRAREAADASRGDAVGEPGDRPDSDPSKQAATKAAEPVDDWPKDYREKFWNAYPVKVAKRKAFGQLETLRNGRKVRFSDLMAGLERYKRTKRHDREWCHPTTWLSQGRWEDETIEQPVRIPPPSTESYRRERPRSNADIYTEIALEADERIRRKRDAQQGPIDGQVIPISSRFGDQEHRYPDAPGAERTGADGGQLSFEGYSSLRRSGGR